eukprot:6489666-Amphidinium_carterae.2
MKLVLQAPLVLDRLQLMFGHSSTCEAVSLQEFDPMANLSVSAVDYLLARATPKTTKMEPYTERPWRQFWVWTDLTIFVVGMENSSPPIL